MIKLSFQELLKLNKEIKNGGKRYCNHCFQIKNLDDFYRGRSECKECSKKNNRKWNEKYPEYKKEWNERNPDYHEKYRKLHKRKKKEYMKSYYKENKEEKISYSRRNHEKNREKRLKKQKEYHKKKDSKPTRSDYYYQYLLPYYEDRIRKDKKGYIEVKCEHNKCQKWFKPTYRQIRMRWNVICGNGSFGSECNMYCSEYCKYKCIKYGKQSLTLMKEDAIRAGKLNWIDLNREVQSELRQMVLKRDSCTCQKCGETEHLHCHHIIPVSIDPIESADIDNCIIYCKECHKEIHQKDGCRYNELKICIGGIKI